MTTDTTTPEQGSALSIHEAAQMLAAARQSKSTPATDTKSTTPAVEEEAEEIQSDETETQEAQSESVETETEESAPDTVHITLPDGRQINADEAAKGYLRQDDYTRKTQGLSQKEKQLQAHFTEAMQRLQATTEQVATLQDAEPDWVELAATLTPQEYQVEYAKYQKRTQLLQSAKHQLTTYQQQQQAQMWGHTLAELSQDGFEPAWRDPDKLQAGLKVAADYALNEGVPEIYLASPLPAAAVRILEKARRYDELQKAKPEAAKAVVNKPKPIKPGAKSELSPAKSDAKTAMNRFYQKRDIDSGLAALRKIRGAA
jgi:hypothetical protein